MNRVSQRHLFRTALLLGCLLPAARVRAHSPHDAVKLVSVTAAADGTQIVFAMMQLTGRELFARSTDGGDSWTITALPVVPREVSRIAISPAFASDGTVMLATTDLGILKSTDGGSSFVLLAGAGLDPRVLELALSPNYPSDQTLLAATPMGISRSVDGGLSWGPSGTGLTEVLIDQIVFAQDQPAVVFAGRQTLHRSVDGGLSWTPVALLDERMAALSVSPGYSADSSLVLALENQGGILFSSDGGASWQAMIQGLSDLAVNDVALGSDGVVYAVSQGAALFRGALGSPFSLVGQGFQDLSDQTIDHYRTVSLSPNHPADGTVWVGAFEGLFVSADNGSSFRQMDIYQQKFARSVVFSPDYASTARVYLQTYGGGVFTSPAYPTVALPDGSSAGNVSGPGGGPGGPPVSPQRPTSSAAGHGAALQGRPMTSTKVPQIAPWVSRSGSITSLFGQRLTLSPDFVVDDTMFYAQVGLWRSRDRALSWEQLTMPAGVTVLRAVTLSPEFSDDQTILLGAGQGAGVFRSRDGGASWTALTAGLPAAPLPAEILISPDFLSDTAVFLADRVGGFFSSSDGGDNWSASNAGLDDLLLRSLAMSPDFAADGLLLAGSGSLGLFRSFDAGASWSAANAGLPANLPLSVESIAFSPDFAADRTIFMAVLAAGVFRSTDGGNSWQVVGPGLPEDAPRVVALSPDFGNDGTLIVSTYSWVYRSQDGGASFARLPGYARLDDGNPALAVSGNWIIEPWIVNGKPDALAIGVSRSNAPGDAVEYHFVGDTIRWYAPLAPDQGRAQVLLDGTTVALVDLYAPQAEGSEVRFEKSFAGVESHTLRIQNSGLANPLASDTVVRSDGFDDDY